MICWTSFVANGFYCVVSCGSDVIVSDVIISDVIISDVIINTVYSTVQYPVVVMSLLTLYTPLNWLWNN